MKVLIKQANIICSSSTFHGQVKDILIIDGVISAIDTNISADVDERIEAANLHLSIGWMDVFANFNDPGQEHKETLESGAAAAAAGGFTDVLILPNTKPAVCTKSIVEYIRQKAATLPVSIHPIGAITKEVEGKDLSEMYDMHASGAIAFSDGTKSLQSPGVLLKALQYVLPIDAVVIQLPDDKSISAHGLMNEGITSTRHGLPGKPAIAEEIMIARDIELLKYTRSKLHITGVSTRKGIALISAAKNEGLNISCSVSPAHLWFCDEDLSGYDSNLKLNPPLRTREDKNALQKAFNDGEIDCIASHHQPQHWDDKTCEFEYAKDGMLGLEVAFSAANTISGNLEQLINQLTAKPRTIFGLPIPEIKAGERACLTLFNPDESFKFEQAHLRSTSSNCAFIGHTLKGKVIGTIHRNKININKN